MEAAGPASPRSFPKALVAAIQRFGDEAFTAASLHAALMKFSNEPASTRVYVQSGDVDDGPIVLPSFSSDDVGLPDHADELTRVMDQGSTKPQMFALVKIRLSTRPALYHGPFAKGILRLPEN